MKRASIAAVAAATLAAGLHISAADAPPTFNKDVQIGRASCRERV